MASDATVNIIRKIEVVEGHGHHGGAWKVAYADFMTAMMAFFLLMWILSSSDEQKLRGIAEYFTNATLPGGSGVLDGATLGPPGTLTASNGATVARGSEFGEVDDPSPAKWEVMDTTPTGDPKETVRGTHEGHHENPAAGAPSAEFNAEIGQDESAAAQAGAQAQAGMAENGEMTQAADGAGGMAAGNASTDQANMTQMAAGNVTNTNPDHTADEERFAEMKAEILQAMQASQDLAPLQKNLIFEKTPAGLRIQIIDQKGQPMFSSGSAKMNDATQKLMALVGESLQKLPNNMVISGHTDAVPFSNKKAYDNWDLSSDRANAMRRVLLKTGVAQDRITRVSGMAATQLLKPDTPKDPTNRRIEVLLAYEAADKPKPKMAKPAMTQTTQAAVAPAPMKTAEAPIAKPTPSVAEQVVPVETVTVLDEAVFENLRSALR
ncbi:flagellar motor protein MotB [Cognatishimia sp. WU-CL00825]|uniref:flagellar motor protein MotB n=1 Tax=Cognatishimia sp. WU-CL00825 TaxID=3127658 RepID=UPI003101F7E3